MKNKGQSSLETLLILMVGITLLIPITNYIRLYQISYRDTYKLSMAKDSTQDLAEAADSIFLQGHPAGITVTINIPEGVKEGIISERTIQLKVKTSSGVNDVFSFTNEDIQGTLPISPGHHKILVKNEGDVVSINEV